MSRVPGRPTRRVMQFDDPIDNPTEATMSAAIISDTATHRYGHAPQSMFAATRVCAEQRARETATAAAATATRSGEGMLRRLATRLGASPS